MHKISDIFFGTPSGQIFFGYIADAGAEHMCPEKFRAPPPECVHCLISLLNCAVNQPNDCNCESGTGGNQDHEDDCKWIATGTKENKHIGSKIRTTRIL